MGLLDKLWDDTLAGPPPETGLGRLRKPGPLIFRSISGKDCTVDFPEDTPRVTRCIMIKRPSELMSPMMSGTLPVSPAGSTPVSPFSGGKERNRFRRNSCNNADEGRVGRGLAKSLSSSYEV